VPASIESTSFHSFEHRTRRLAEQVAALADAKDPRARSRRIRSRGRVPPHDSSHTVTRGLFRAADDVVPRFEGRLAPRRSEHVACAGGRDVLAAGEIRLDGACAVAEVTNNSTGYCPPEDCWEAVRLALDAAGMQHPSGFTFVAHFRRCPRCRERNLVKDDWYVCAMCDAELPFEWNFGDG
jgi:hypothetical protein